jgi:hypothetical protein
MFGRRRRQAGQAVPRYAAARLQPQRSDDEDVLFSVDACLTDEQPARDRHQHGNQNQCACHQPDRGRIGVAERRHHDSRHSDHQHVVGVCVGRGFRDRRASLDNRQSQLSAGISV